MKNEYDVPYFWCIIAQLFYNTMVYNDSFALNCIEKVMNEHAIKKFPGIIDWQVSIIQLAMPYEKGNIDDDPFVYD